MSQSNFFIGVAPIVFSKYIFSISVEEIFFKVDTASKSLQIGDSNIEKIGIGCWNLANRVPCLSFEIEETEDWLLTWCWSIDKLWSWRFSTSFLSFSPATSGLKRTIAFKQANSEGSMERSLNISMKESRIVKEDAKEGEMSVNWDLEKMVAEWRGRHHWIEQSKNSSDQLSSRRRA